MLEHNVGATADGGVVADIEEPGSILDRELERRKRRSSGLRGCGRRHGTPLVGTRGGILGGDERGGASRVDVERLGIITEVGVVWLKCSIGQLEGIPGRPAISACRKNTVPGQVVDVDKGASDGDTT